MQNKFNSKIFLVIIIILLVIGLVYFFFNNNSKQEKENVDISTDFNMIFKYGVGAGNILDTFSKTYIKDMFPEEPIETSLELSKTELQNVYNKIVELDLFNKTKTPVQNSNMQRTPCSSFYLKTEINSILKELSWNDCNGEIKEEFKQFTDYIIKIVESKSEYQKLPSRKGGYM